MVEIMLLAMLVIGLFGAVALGIEDTRHWNKVEANPPKIIVRVHAEFWEDSLPHRPSLPWAENATA